MAQTYKAPNGRLCVIQEGAKPAKTEEATKA